MKIFSKKIRGGTTLVELIIVIAIITVIASVSLPSLLTRKGQTDLTGTVQKMASVLREARSRSVSQSSSTSWGVHFDNSASGAFFAMFYSQTYSNSTRSNYYALPANVVYATSSIASGSYKEITFSQISGQASASTSITLYLIRGVTVSSSTINVASSGAVSF